MCTHVYISVTKWTVGHLSDTLWDLWDGCQAYIKCHVSSAEASDLTISYLRQSHASPVNPTPVSLMPSGMLWHDDVIKWKHFPRNWPFVREIQRSPVNSPHKGQWRGALMFSLICVWINDWENNREAGDLRRYRAHSDVIVMGTRRMIYWLHWRSWP